MNTSNNSIPSLSVGKLLRDDTQRYRIPMYQRNYAWGEAEIIQLIQDVADYLTKKDSDYYIGTLVVYERKENGKTIHEVIDGQQRLTTLALLVSYLKHRSREDGTDLPEDSTDLPTSLNIDFECREHSTGTLKSLFDKGNVDLIEEKKVNKDIRKGYRIIKGGVSKVLKEHKEYTDHEETLRKFKECLLERVRIIPVPVPEGTDLNHYFEIMNTRGEQLEEHEVLKAKMMKKLKKKDEQDTFQTIWEACANMDKYVQMSIPSDLREEVFGGDCRSFKCTDFDQLNEELTEEQEAGKGNNSDHKKSLSEIIKGPIPEKQSNGNSSVDEKERFSSVINFPNFLLQVLRVVYPKADVSLDDKKLMDMFNEHVLNQNEAAKAVRAFAFELLRCRYLFDRYVPKQERLQEGTSWSLKKFKKGNDKDSGYYVNTFSKQQNEEEDDTSLDGDKILLLLSAFHVSAPTQSYKHWLTATLHWLRKEYIRKEQQKDKGDIDGKAYLEQLETIARAFVFDRFLAVGGEAPREYSNMIDVEKCKTTSFDHEKLCEKLSYTNITNNFVFNFLDYLLWCKLQGDDKIKNFRFTFRSSVEHYYPQNPVGEHADKQKPENIDSFGNLCLISHSKNSKLSNYLPEAKKEHYDGKGSIDSIKQYLMMQKKDWGKEEIEKHEKEMVKVLETSLKGLQALSKATP